MITVLGEAFIDLVPASDDVTLTAIPGGSPLDVAVGLVRLGHPAALMARLSDDRFGQLLRRHAARNGVDLGSSAEADEPATLASVARRADPAGSRRYYLDGTADWQWSAAELARIPAATTLLHLGSLACCVAPGAARVLRAAARQRRRGALVCIDPAVCPQVMGTPARGRLLVERTITTADVVKASTKDISWLYPGRAVEDVAQHWLQLGPDLVVMTRGSRGAVALRPNGTVLHRPGSPAPVVSTAGAGNAFTAGLLGGLHQLRQAGASVRGLSSHDLAGLLDTAAFAAALACQRTGSDLPHINDIRYRRNRHPQADSGRAFTCITAASPGA